MNSGAPDVKHQPTSFSSSQLKRDLSLSYFSLTALGVVILLIGLLSTFWLRDYALDFINESAPRVAAVEKLQKGLEKSTSNLFAWISSKDNRYRKNKKSAWHHTIYPALAELKIFGKKRDHLTDNLDSIEEQLKTIEMWQWHIEEVIHTEGNFPGKWIYENEISPIFSTIHSSSKALLSLHFQSKIALNTVNDHQSKTLSNHIFTLQSSIFLSNGYLKNFLDNNLAYNIKHYKKELTRAEKSVSAIIKLHRNANSDQRDQLVLLNQSLTAFSYSANKIIAVEGSIQSNVAKNWLDKICLPLIAKLNLRLTAMNEAEHLIMQKNSKKIHNIAAIIPWIMAAMLVLMIVISIYLARKKIKQFVEPVVLLEKQEKLKSELSALDNLFYDANNLKQLCLKYLTSSLEQTQSVSGSLYLEKNNDLTLAASYAANEHSKEIIPAGEGLLGQVYSSKKSLLISPTSNQKFTLKSSLLTLTPKQVLIAPILFEEKVLAVIELVSLNLFSPYQKEFIDLSLSRFGIVLNDAVQKDTIKSALTQSQRQSAELKVQQTELKASNDNLVEQAQQLKLSEEELKQQTEELRVTNDELFLKQKSLFQQKNQIEISEKELISKVKELALSSKYKSEFLANMSHELRTPLNSLLLLAKGLVDNRKGNLDEEDVEDAQIIYDGGQSLLSLINDILDLSKVEAGKLNINVEKVELSALLNRLIKMFDHVATHKNLTFVTNIDEGTPEFIANDGQRIEQILRNLISNGIKFTEFGSVSLNISLASKNTVFLRKELANVDVIALSVIDTGIGIYPEKLQVIFQAFQQEDGSTSRKYGGTGLGLTIAKELSSLLGGEIHISSVQSQGSTFTLFLPRQFSEETLPHQHEGALSASEQQTTMINEPIDLLKKSNIINNAISFPIFIDDDRNNIEEKDKVLLVIDDDIVFAKILRDFINEQGYKCIVAGNGQSGLSLAQHYQPNGILLDLMLPDIDGHQVLAQLKLSKETQSIPVEIISAHDENKANAIENGAIGLLIKPVTKEQLQNVLTRISNVTCSELKNFLVVEDDYGSRIATAKLLDQSGINSICVETGEKAYKEIMKNSFDCIILDLGLPDMSGLELLERIHAIETYQVPPVIVYTGREINDDEQAKLQHYASTIIIKGQGSPERLLDDVSLFMKHIESDIIEPRVEKIVHDDIDMLRDRKILLVDDDMRNSYALSKRLIEFGFQVDLASNGLESLEILTNNSNYELILMDTMMPIMDGYEATKQIRLMDQYKNLPIIALTAKTMPEDRDTFLNAGASEYLTKPIDFNKLVSILRIWLFKQQ